MEASRAPGQDPLQKPLLWRILVIVGLTSLVAGALWLAPLIGLLLLLGSLVVCLPVGRTLGLRLTFVLLACSGGLALLFTVASWAIDRIHIVVAASLALLAASAWSLTRGIALPSVGVRDVALLGGAALQTFLVGAPYLNQPVDELLSGLFVGWDHSSHFILFANTYEAGGIHFAAGDGGDAFGAGYPPLHAVFGAVSTELLANARLERAQLIPWYIGANVVTCVVATFVLSVIAVESVRRLIPGEPRRWMDVVLACTVVLGIALSPVSFYFNLGHVNFLFGFALMIGCGWLAAAERETCVRDSALVLVLGIPALWKLWPPLAIGLLPAGVVLFAALLRHRPRAAWGSLAFGLAAGAVLLRVLSPDVSALMSHLAGSAGGVVPQNVMWGLLSGPLFLGVGIIVSLRIGWRQGVGLSGPPLALLSVAATVGLAAWRSPTMWGSAYYFVKPLGIIGLWASVVACALVSLSILAFTGEQLEQVEGRRASGLVGSCLLAFSAALLAAFGYVGPKPASIPRDSDLAAGYAAYLERMSGVESVAEGQLVFAAYDAAKESRGNPLVLPIHWTGGDLKNNRWLRALIAAESVTEDQLLSSMNAPYHLNAEQATGAMRRWLDEHGNRTLEVVHGGSEGLAPLLMLADAYPGRVTIVER